jgi:uncharacterized protein
MSQFSKIAFTPSVKAVQERMGSRRAYARLESPRNEKDALGEDEKKFISERDSSYMASVSEDGWPYIQHRGGPKGFVRVLDEYTLGFADYRGNRQYISLGNLSKNDRVALIFVDYPSRTRLKVFAHAAMVTVAESPETMAKLSVPGYVAHVEGGFLLKIEGFDWNCPQHITPRFTEEDVRASVAPLLARIDTLEKENSELRVRTGPTVR